MECIKLNNAQQAQSTYAYRNTKKKLHRTNAATWFMKICCLCHLARRYINITVNGRSQQYIAHLQQQCHNWQCNTRRSFATTVSQLAVQHTLLICHNTVTTGSATHAAHLPQHCHNWQCNTRRSFATTVSQLKICDFSGETFKGFEVL
jgi:hypothetical protein